MTKQLLKPLRLRVLMLVALLCAGFSSAWGEVSTYQHVFKAKPSTGDGVTLSGVSWTISATNLGSYNSSNYAGVQIGSSKSNGSIKLTSSSNWSYNGKTKITEVRLWLNLGGTSVTPTVTIGGKAATSDGTAVIKNSSAGSDWTKATKVTFTPAADGNTGVVIINVATVKAGYICAMEIDCVEEGAPEPCATPTFFPAAGTYTSAQDVEISTTTQDATIYYTTNGDNPTTSSDVYNGAINVDKTMTIKAIAVKDNLNNSGVASATYTIVNLDHAGTKTDPYTVADAYKAIENGIGANGAYIKGIVSRLFRDDIMSDGTNYRYYISDDGNTNKELLVFKGKGLNNVAFSNANDLQAGDIVVIYGKLTLYNSTKEIDEDNYIVSLTRKEVPTLTFSEDQYSVVKNGNLTITATSNSSGTITYTSSNTDVAEVNATTGAITAKTAGTTNITATIAATDDYKSATATVELTVTAPKHTVTFYQNGTKLSEEEVVEDAAIEFPVPAAELYGKRFVGWTTATIDGETNDKPAILVTAATMATTNVVYYAVYAYVEGEEKSSTLTNGDITEYFTKEKPSYGTPKSYSDEINGVTWSASCNADAAGRPWIQIKKEAADAYFKVNTKGKIANIKLTITSATNSSGGVADITKHTAFSGTVYMEETASASPQGALGSGSSSDITNNSITLIPTSSVNEVIIQVSAAARIWDAEVTYDNSTYSDYCTTVKEQATIRLYLPNNPEGNLTEHQLSCSSAVILNVDTNSPGAITIQDMTDGITVIPNTGNKTVTLRASTNNGKVFSQPGEYTFRVVVGETDSYTSASVDFKLKVVKFKSYFNNLTGFEETKDLANGTNGGQLKDQLFSNTQWGDASYKTWTSTNEDVATIDNDGNITLISTGQVRFTHSYTGNDYNEPCKISTGVMTVIDTTPVAAPAKPIVFHDGGEGVTYEGELTVPMFAEEGATIYYTTDGTEPTAASTEYTKPLNISTNTTLKAIAVKDGVESDVVTREYRIEAVDAPDINLDGYYSIKNNNGNYVNVAGRKTVTFVDKNTSKTAAGTVIRVKTTNGKVEVLRSQGVDVPRYAERAMSYVPELVKELMKRLSENVENPIIGEDGANLITDEVMDLDYNLYLEEADGGYRIYGKTPSMQRVVDFYATNKTIIDERLPRLEEFVEDVLLKVAERLDHPNSEWASKFKILDIWAKLVVTNPDLTKPEEGNAEAISKFYTEILSSEANIWNFAHETMMIYWKKVDQLINDPESQYASMLGDLGDYKKYLEKVPNILPNFKYYIVSDGSGIDFISEGNEDIINDAARTVWTLEGRENFNVTFLKDNALSSGRELYTTLYTDFAYKLPDGVKAYAITGVNETTGVATKEEFPSNIIPAQTPVLLQATFDAEQTADQTKTLELTTEAGTTPETNLLVGADYLINEYEINSPTAEGMFTILATLSQSLADKYEYLKRKNAGTVNNKYFFGLDDADLDLCVENKDCVVRNLGTGENQPLAFYGDWQAPKSNQAFLVSETFNPILLTLKGDVYRDGVIDNKDLTALVEIVLGKVTLENKPENYDFDAAHVNEDEDINIADVTALVNILKPQPQTNN